MMSINIIEIKARCENAAYIRKILEQHNADYKGKDHQIDTYFNAPLGRLKLREGNIENTLIHYHRVNQHGPKNSKVTYQKLQSNAGIKEVLHAAMGILVVVDKKRDIFFIDNVKFHLDEVQNLGRFVEIEAIDETGQLGLEKLQEQCQFYMDLFRIEQANLIDVSYSDLLMAI